MNHMLRTRAMLVAAGLALASAAGASVLTDNLERFDADGVKGYLGPLQIGIGQAMNSNYYWTADIPTSGFGVSLDVFGMRVNYKDEDKTFTGTAPNDPSGTEATASTVVGPGESTTIIRGDGTGYVFPGGFDMDWQTLAVPQLSVVVLPGTELAARWVKVSGIEDFGDIQYLGFGARHLISQYFPNFPVALAASGWYQKFDIDDDVIEMSTWSLGVQASKGLSLLTLFGSVAFDHASMDVNFLSDVTGTAEMVTASLDSETALHLAGGGTVKLAFLHANVALEYAKRFGYSVGIGFGL